MPIQVAGFAKGLVRCLDFASVSAEQLDGVLETCAETLELDYVEPSAETPLIESGSEGRSTMTGTPQQTPTGRPPTSASQPSGRAANSGSALQSYRI